MPSDSDYDSPWKEAINRYFGDFMAFFFPDGHAEIDWTRGYTSLDRELQRIVPKAEIGRRTVDSLMRVYLRSGKEAWVMVHVEVQSQVDASFPERMYIYNYRLYDRYHNRVASLAVLGDDDPTWRPSEFSYTLLGCRETLAFPIVKLLDYPARGAALIASGNPFGVLTAAHLASQATQRNLGARYDAKLGLILSLYRHGYGRKAILELFRFLDWLLVLPEDLDNRLQEEVAQFEKEQGMPYISSFERIARRKGLEQGLQEGLQQGLEQGLEQGRQEGRQEAWIERSREALLAVLAARFGALPSVLTDAIMALADAAPLTALLPAAATAASLDEFERRMAATVTPSDAGEGAQL